MCLGLAWGQGLRAAWNQVGPEGSLESGLVTVGEAAGMVTVVLRDLGLWPRQSQVQSTLGDSEGSTCPGHSRVTLSTHVTPHHPMPRSQMLRGSPSWGRGLGAVIHTRPGEQAVQDTSLLDGLLDQEPVSAEGLRGRQARLDCWHLIQDLQLWEEPPHLCPVVVALRCLQMQSEA